MGTISVIPTRAALKKGFEHSSLVLTQRYDPVKLISLPQEEQDIFVRQAVDLILQDIEPETYPVHAVMRTAATRNLQTMLQKASDAFTRDSSEASQDCIRREWQKDMPKRIDSVRSLAMTAFQKDRDAPTQSADLKVLITKPVLLQRFQQAAFGLRAIDLQHYYDLPDVIQHGHVESIVRTMTEGTRISDAKKIDFYQTLHQKIRDVSDLLNMTPYIESTVLMSQTAMKCKGDMGAWAVDFVYAEVRSLKF